MLPRKKRVDTGLFKDLLKKGRIFSGDLFTIRFYRETNPFPSRIAIVISKKVCSKASARNSLKRKISTVVEKLYPNFEKSFVVAIFPKKTVLITSSFLIQEDLQGIFQKMSIL